MNEIKLVNGGEEISITFNGIEYKIPSGHVTVSEKLANHILFIAKKWKLDIKRESDLKYEKQELKKDIVAEDNKEEEVAKEESKEELEEKEEEKLPEPKKNKKK